jgi:hypothetical protein
MTSNIKTLSVIMLNVAFFVILSVIVLNVNRFDPVEPKEPR